jgi:hypothetical protein
LKIIISPYKNGANEYGNTHSVAVDTYKHPARDSGGEINGNIDQEFFK